VITNYSSLLDLMNTRYIITPPNTPPALSWFKKELSTENGTVWSNYRVVPRVLISARARVINSPVEILDLLKQSSYRPREEIIFEELPLELFLNGSDSPGNAVIEKYSSREIIIRAKLTSPGILLLNDSYSPGWRAYVDGDESKIYRANYLMRAVCLESGSHTIRFLYQPSSFTIGAIISIAILIILISLLLIISLRSYYTRKRQ
jgi:hypothetical protein